MTKEEEIRNSSVSEKRERGKEDQKKE